MLWFAVRLPYLGFEALGLQNDLRVSVKPMVVTEAQRIYLISPAAQEAGIRVQSSLATARSLAPELVHHARDQEAETRRTKQLVLVAYEFTPSVSVAAVDALLLEMQGSLKLFGGVNEVRYKLRDRFHRCGHVAAIGIAHTPRASLVLASSPVEAVWPDYPSAAETERIAMAQLANTSLAHLEIADRDRERLANMGLHQIGELLELPAHELGKRFDADLMDYLAQLTGELRDPWDIEQPVAQFNDRLHLIEPVRDKDEVLEPMEHLVTTLAKWLERLHLGVKQLRWGIYTFDGEGATFEVAFEQPRYTASEIMAITVLRLEMVDLPGEVMTVALSVLRAEPQEKSWVARDVLGMALQPSAPPREFLERLSARLGPEALQQYCILDDHRPEFAWMPADIDCASAQAELIPECGRRPLWLLEPPTPIKAERLRIISGPERIQSGWWDKELRRDYFVARDRDQAWCWCFRDATGWFLHGYFA